MRKILLPSIAIILFTGLSSGVLSYLNFDIGQFFCKVMAYAKADSNAEQVNIKISTIAFKTLSDKHEICLGGKLYDVKKLKIEHDSVELLLSRDVYEEKLITGIVSLIAQGDHFSDTRDAARFNKHKSYIPDGKILVHGAYSLCSLTIKQCSYIQATFKALIDYCDNNVIKPPPRSYIF